MDERENLQEMMEQENTAVQREDETVPQRKKSRWIGRVFAIILSVSMLLAVGYTVVLPAARYHTAVDALENGDYAAALVRFEQLGNYKDAAELLLEAEKGIRYLEAGELAERRDYESAWVIYDELGDFLDSDELAKESRYLCAQELAGQEKWKEAREIFLMLEDYKDAEELVILMQNELDYRRALSYLEQEQYMYAYSCFCKLGGFRDAEKMARESKRLHETNKKYLEALKNYQQGYWVDAYQGFEEIREENYKDTELQMAAVVTELKAEIMRFADEGETVKMLGSLEEYTEIDQSAAEEFKAEIIAQGMFELDDSFDNFASITPPATFSADMSAEDFALIIMHMYMTGKTRLTLRPRGSISYSDKSFDRYCDRFIEGGNMADELLPTQGTVYDSYIYLWWDGIVFEKMEITLSSGEGYTTKEMKEHITTADAFCEESVRQLMEVGLLRNSMSYRQKVMTISDWLGNYLIYDDPKTIHDAGVAVKKGSGVCESYAALFNRMCNLVGVPTWGQSGDAGEQHMWSIHLDENGQVFYSDATWADGGPAETNRTVEEYCQLLIKICELKKEVWKVISNDYYRENLNKPADDDKYIWSETIWDTHTEERSAEEIIAFYESRVA